MTTATRIPARPRPTTSTPEPQVPTGPQEPDSRSSELLTLRRTLVAALPATGIRQRDCVDLLALIRLVDLPLPDECLCRLEFQDRCTLELLAFRAQRALRNQGY